MTQQPVVLLIEDNPVDTLLIKKIFAEFNKGFDLICADTLSKGLDLLADSVYQIKSILLDLNLPDSKGFDTFSSIHSHSPALPIVILTGLDDELISIRAVQEGAQDYLVKGQVSGPLLVRSIQYAIERNQVKEELKESRKRYKSLFDDSPTPMWEEDFSGVKQDIDSLKENGVTDFGYYFDTNPELVKSMIKKVKVLDINKAVLNLHNAYSKEEIKRDLTIVFTEQTYQTIRHELTMIAQGIPTFDFTQVFQTIDNNIRYVIVRWMVVPGYEHSLSRVVISIIDITEFTKAEGELRESESMLKEAQKVAHIGSWTLNPVTDEITWSDELFRIFGLVPGPEAPKLTDYHAFFDGTERDKFLSAIQKLLQDELDFEIELNIKRPSGEERTILSKGRIKHKENNEKLVVGTFQDITDRKKIEIELNNIDNLKTDYLIFISQQIRTPLDAVVGTLNLIKSQDHSTGIKKLLETLNESVSKLEDYTNKAILFSQLSQKKYLPKVNFLNLRELVQFAALELNSRIKEKHVILNIQVLDNTLFVNADRDLIFKALVFILDNALDYSSNDGKINVTFFEEETRVHCRIIDFGPGFTEDHLNMLMNPVHPIREKNFQKSGLSMFIVRLIMNIHGGSLQMYNTDQGGACVELELNK